MSRVEWLAGWLGRSGSGARLQAGSVAATEAELAARYTVQYSTLLWCGATGILRYSRIWRPTHDAGSVSWQLQGEENTVEGEGGRG